MTTDDQPAGQPLICMTCHQQVPLLDETGRPYLFELPEEPEVGAIVRIEGGRFNGVAIAHLRAHRHGWQTVGDPDGEWHTWGSVFAVADEGRTSTPVRIRIVRR